MHALLEKCLAVAGSKDDLVQTLRHTMAVHPLAQGTPHKTRTESLGDVMETLPVYMVLARKLQRRCDHRDEHGNPGRCRVA